MLNPEKCTLWGPGTRHLRMTPPYDMLSGVKVIPFREGSGTTVLGVPVNFPGSHVQTDALWKLVPDAVQLACSRLPSLHNTPMQHLLLQSCLDACKVTHLLRAADSFGVQERLQQASALLRSSMEDLLGQGLSDWEWGQCRLPFRLGGLGLKCPLVVRSSARIA